jgi:glycerol dehydrogenase
MAEINVDMHGIRAFGSTHRYFQGPGALALVGEIVQSLGRSPLLVADEVVQRLIGETAASACASYGLTLKSVQVHGEVTRSAVQALVQQACAGGIQPDVVLAAGGGKGVDTGKAVALELGARLVVIPTSASNDGPCSRLFVYYDDCHRMASVEKMPRNPDAVLVDTNYLIKAPKAMLISGIGDALCKLYEGNQTRGSGGLNSYGGRNTLAAEQLCLACDRVVRENAVAGLAALGSDTPNEAFERLTEALVLLSGLAFENSGLSIAHSLTRGLPLAEGTSTTLHGMHVGYGLLVQFILEERDVAFMQEQLAFYRSVGLATSLAAIGAKDCSLMTLQKVARATMASPHMGHFQRSLGEADLVSAMSELERLSTAFELSNL